MLVHFVKEAVDYLGKVMESHSGLGPAFGEYLSPLCFLYRIAVIAVPSLALHWELPSLRTKVIFSHIHTQRSPSPIF